MIPRRIDHRPNRGRRWAAILVFLTAVVAAGCGGSGGAVGSPPSVSATRQPGVTSDPRPTAISAPPRPTSTPAPPTTLPWQPAAIPPRVSPARPGEGVWAPADTWRAGPAPVLTTTFRPDPAQPQLTAYLAWIRTSNTQLGLYPGYEGPGPTTSNRGPEMVPLSGRGRLLATFNSGFYERDAAAGFYAHGTLYFPMRKGLATVVAYADGHVNVVDWQGGSVPPPDVVVARQNLSLLVDRGAAAALVDDGASWGLTLHGATRVWRTGLGIDSSGNLIYAAAPDQTAGSLASILMAAGAVRAMELDINPEWPIFVTYRGPGATGPALFVPNPNQIPDRFLYPSTKDFFAVFGRVAGTQQPPW